jgi:cysteine desulfurase
VQFPGVSGNAILAHAPEVAASTGSACHAGHEAASAVILAMGVSAGDALGTIRLTLGRATTPEDVALASDALVSAWRAVHTNRFCAAP